jgi:hypothetical protein
MSRSEAHDQRNAQFREAFKKPFDFKSVASPTSELVPTEAKNLGLAHYVEDIPNSDGARLHWLGNPEPQKILLYFHGKTEAASCRLHMLTEYRWRFCFATNPRSRSFLEADR